MIVKRPTYDRGKLGRLVEQREAAYAALMRLGDRLRESRDTMQTAQAHLKRWTQKHRGDAPTALAAPIERYAAEYEAVAAEHERAQKHWQSIAEVVDPLRAAADKFMRTGAGKSTIEVTETSARETVRAGIFTGVQS